jgi:ABC-type arginine/histidine transport system permease subunit|tara:strand:+ start:369 stop:902 length:534 start_codon:yes stop_codon:yes gene_type:complete
MSILTLFTNPLSLSIIATILIIFPLPFLLGYLFKNQSKYFFELISVCIFLISSILSFLISIYSSGKQCGKYRMNVSIKKGLTYGLYTTLIYLTIFFIPFFKKPFIELGQDNLLWNSMGEGFFIGMSSISFTIMNYFSSQVDGCKLSNKEAAIEYTKMEKKLKSRKKKASPSKITIKQ